MTELEALVTLNASRALGQSALGSLLRHFGSPEAILRATERDLAATGAVSAAVARRVLQAGKGFDAGREVARAAELGIEILPQSSDRFPGNLRNIFDPPLLLYAKGGVRETDRLALALVGSRRCSHYGRTQAERLAMQLASMGFCIVSGLAYGIDAAAHRGALGAGGRTVAVLGCGLGRVYPAHHEALAEEIGGHGALLSELPLDAAPAAGNFPARNRIISGLSLGVIVVEAAKQSGSLTTAKWAAEQGREVFAVPGPLDSPVSQGSNALIQDGAKLVQSAKDIVAELGPLAEALQLPDGRRVEDPRGLNLTGNEAKIFGVLSSKPCSIEEIIMDSGLGPAVVNGALLTLEIKGLARRWAGMRFTRI